MRVDGALEAIVIASVLLGWAALHTHRRGALVGSGLVGAGTFTDSVGLCESRLYGLVLGGQEDDLAVCRLRHGLHGL